MCYVWEGQIERCEQCSETDFQTLLRVVWNIGPATETHQMVARTNPHPFNPNPPSSSRQGAHVDLQKDVAAENLHEHIPTWSHQVGPSSSRQNFQVDVPGKHKRQKMNEDQTCFSTHDTRINGTGQHGRQDSNPGQYSSSIHNARVDRAAQREKQGKNAVQVCSSRHYPRTAGTSQSGQQNSSQTPTTSSRQDARADGATPSGPQAKDHDPSSSSRNDAITDLTGDEEHQRTTQFSSQNHPRIEDMEVLTAGMNKLPPPCWGDERVFCPLAQQQLSHDEYFEHQKQELDEIWAMYGKERKALAASQTPEPEDHWTPVFQEEEILERKIPLEEEIWAISMLEGEAWMRNILDEDETWPQESPEEADIWTRDDGGMLSAAVWRRLLRVFTLQASLEEGRVERSDEMKITPWRMKEGDEVAQEFSEAFTSAAYPPLASQAQD